jgi:hypothetical protein
MGQLLGSSDFPGIAPLYTVTVLESRSYVGVLYEKATKGYPLATGLRVFQQPASPLTFFLSPFNRGERTLFLRVSDSLRRLILTAFIRMRRLTRRSPQV